MGELAMKKKRKKRRGEEKREKRASVHLVAHNTNTNGPHRLLLAAPSMP